MTIFYPEKKLNAMKALFGGGLLRFKEFLITLVVVFSLYTLVLSFLLVFLTQLNDLSAISLVFSTITSGGFVPSSNLVSQAQPEVLAIVTGGMILSALPFAFHYNLFYKGGMLKKLVLTPEVKAYLVLMATCIPLFYLITYASGQLSADPISAAFHVISASTTTGFQYMNISSLPGVSKTFMIVLMLVGGTAFSTAGGIKVGRFLILYREFISKNDARKVGKKDSEKNNGLTGTKNETNGSLPASTPSIDMTLTSISSSTNPERDYKVVEHEEEENRLSDIIEMLGRRGKQLNRIKEMLRMKIVKEILIVMLLYVSIPVLSAAAISLLAYNTSFDNALFESVSAITTTGLTAGVTSTTLD
jgi:trk system potassium uptake protein TrkH